MRQLTITVPEARLRHIQKLLRQEPGVIVSRSRPISPEAAPAKKPLNQRQQKWVDELKQALVDVERHQRGEIKLVSGDEHLAELRAMRDKKWPLSK